MNDVLGLIDLERYPINDLDGSAARAVIDDARHQIAKDGLAELPGFITQSGVAALVADADRLSERAHPSGGVGTRANEFPSVSRDR